MEDGRAGRGHAVVVHCHPKADSFAAATTRTVVDVLGRSGRTVTLLDLYAERFDPVLRRDELRGAPGSVPADLVHHVEAVKSADILVFVYPTWWSGLPAMLKGWIDRVMMQGVAWNFGASGRVRPALANVRHIVGVSTYGSPWTYVKFVNDNGRRTLLRALRMTCGRGTRTTFVGLYAMDTQDDAGRAAHLRRVARKVAAL